MYPAATGYVLGKYGVLPVLHEAMYMAWIGYMRGSNGRTILVLWRVLLCFGISALGAMEIHGYLPLAGCGSVSEKQDEWNYPCGPELCILYESFAWCACRLQTRCWDISKYYIHSPNLPGNTVCHPC